MARERIEELPLLVIAASQTEGRGRSGAPWVTADRALAASLAFRPTREDDRPFSLMAGVAAARAVADTTLKWPNDVLRDGLKVGGVLVERNEVVTTIGFGLNLWWPEPGEGAGAVFDSDPGERAHAEIGALWGAELMEIIEGHGWPIDDYRSVCSTLGQSITWEPGGSGFAREVADDGSLLVEGPSGVERLYSGQIRHVRPG